MGGNIEKLDIHANCWGTIFSYLYCL